MTPQSLAQARNYADWARTCAEKSQNKAKIIIVPSFVYLSEIAGLLKRTKVKLGAQDVFWENSGTYTGEISSKMLKNLGVEYVIVGHSERRKFLDETDEMINKKVLAALKAGLKVILCIGEIERTTNNKQLTTQEKNFVKKQLEKDLKGIKKLLGVGRKSLVSNLAIAYEPVWAIGAGRSDTPEDAAEMIKFIKSLIVNHFSLITPVLYGGSVDSKNIKNFIQYKEIDGVLVGHASLKRGEIKKIIKSISK